jgi:hypothetical protein
MVFAKRPYERCSYHWHTRTSPVVGSPVHKSGGKVRCKRPQCERDGNVAHCAKAGTAVHEAVIDPLHIECGQAEKRRYAA